MNIVQDIIFRCGFFLIDNPNSNSAKTTNWSSTLDMLGQFFFLVVIFALIIAIAVYSLRYAARLKNYTGGNNNLRVIESRSLGFNNYVHLVKAGDKYIMVGASKDKISFLAEINKESITDVFDKAEKENPLFDNLLTAHIKKMINKQAPPKE